MGESGKPSSEKMEATAFDVEFLPLVLLHKRHRTLRSSQVEIVPLPYYLEEPSNEPVPEAETEPEPEAAHPPVLFAPPLPALKEKNNWWDFVKPVYAFNDPVIRSRLELLMKTNIVQITDRKYMLRLQERIRDNHLDIMRKRIQKRAADEIEREKNLLLEGKITFEEAPVELKNHPVCRINQTAKKIIDDKRSKIRSLDKTSAYRTSQKRIKEAERCARETLFEKEPEEEDLGLVTGAKCFLDTEVSEDIVKGYMFSEEDYDKLKYEDPNVKLLRETDGIQEMYDLADTIMSSIIVTKPDDEESCYRQTI